MKIAGALSPLCLLSSRMHSSVAWAATNDGIPRVMLVLGLGLVLVLVLVLPSRFGTGSFAPVIISRTTAAAPAPRDEKDA